MILDQTDVSAVFSDLAGKQRNLDKTFSEILAEVGEACGVTPAQLLGYSRKGFIVRARQLAMYEMRAAGGTHEGIGEFLNRDHSTVIRGVRKIEELTGKEICSI